jgi:hypothetical protein
MSRTPARATYDAAVGLDPTNQTEPGFAYVLVKHTYEIKGGRAMLCQPEPLLFDIWSDEELQPRFPLGSDFWVNKERTDVVICGSAFAPGGRPAPSMYVSAQVGRTSKRIAVFGRREVEWPGGRPRLGRPEPLIEMPLVNENAFGGLDNRVPIPADLRDEYMRLVELGMQFDHPGLYPRNPVGKGYVVLPDPIPGLELPNLEDPTDMLTAERLITGKPELWYRQPLPWCLDWTPGLTFPRYLHVGVDPWFLAPQDTALPEVRRGFTPVNVRHTVEQEQKMSAGYLQEASLGMVVGTPLAGQPIVLAGMHPDEPEIAFSLPSAPSVDIIIEGERFALPPLLTSLVLFPAEKRFTTVYCARTKGLPRVFIPGIHKNIPLSASINRDAPIVFQSPPTIRERLAAAAASA